MVKGEIGAAIARPILVSVDISETEDSVVAEVHLQIGTEAHRGVAAKAGDHLEAAVAEATIRGVAHAANVKMRVDAAGYAHVGVHTAAIVVVVMDGMARPLTGSALDVELDGTAYARASLDAINRIVTNERLMSTAVVGTSLGTLGF